MTDRVHWSRFRLVQLLSYALLRWIALGVGMIPYAAAGWVGRVIAIPFRWFDRRGCRWALRNLKRMGLPDARVPSFIRRVYEHFSRSMVETLIFLRLCRNRDTRPYARFESMEILDRELAKGKGVIVTIGHLGNWELAGLASCLAGYKLHSLAQPVKNPYIDRWIRDIRTTTGQRILPKSNVLPAMAKVLKAGGILVIQVDLDDHAFGVLVDFLGHPAATVTSPAMLSLRYEAPIVPGDIYRDAKGIHHFRLTAPVQPEDYRGRADAITAVTQAFTSRFEEFVRRHPEQWLWIRPRWESRGRAKAAQRKRKVPADRNAGVPDG